MIYKRTLALGLALAMAVVAVPVQADVASGNKGMNACVQAMIEDMSGTGETPLKYQTDSSSDAGRGVLKQRETFHLDARNSVTGEVVARVDCVVDHQARVSELVVVPLDAGDSEDRAASGRYSSSLGFD